MSFERVAVQKRKQLWRRRWYGVCVVLCAVAVFITTYALILPALTEETAVYCGMEEHSHEDTCIQIEYLCGLTEMEDSHLHSEECIATEQVLLCALPEEEGHLHNASCYAQRQELCCDLEEGEEHAHGEACYAPSTELLCALPECEGHTHEYSCYESRTTYVCGLAEGHLHTDTCYQELQVSCCILTEDEGHIHEASCFTSVKELICDLEAVHVHDESCMQSLVVCALAEHTHGLACYSNPSADVEVQELWENTLPPLTGDKIVDIMNIAQSQLGYRESEKNYIVSEDGVVKGYSRYGQWYGDAYGDWCAMFAAFCLRYAGFEEVPIHSNCQRWVEALSEAELYMPAGVYIPQCGDIIFFDLDGDNTADHVGLVAEADDGILTIEGNAGDAVQARQYSREDGTVLGYGVLSQIDAAPPKRGLEGNYLNVGNAQSFTTEVNRSSTTHIRLTANFSISTAHSIPANKNLTIDLNGYTLTYTNTSSAMFTVESGETLTIWDSQQPTETVTMAEYDPENRREYPATLSGESLTYYVMTTQVVDPALGATQEAVQQHVFTAAGGIQADCVKETDVPHRLVLLKGGTFNLEGGMLYGDGNSTTNENRAIYIESGTANLNGGYICGFARTFSGTLDASTQFGGAIYMTGGTVNVMGSVLAANTAGSAGAIYSVGGTVNIGSNGEKVGIIAGNQALSGREAGSGKGYNGGGGIYVKNGTVNMTAGYLTNNIVVNYTESNRDTYGGYYSGGGGVFMEGSSKMDFCGGYITGNWADGGGGIRTSHDGTNYITMYCKLDENENVISAPFVTANTVRAAEGAGISLGPPASNGTTGATITGGYITNNQILGTEHWGGGGIFGFENSKIHIEDALIVNNYAGGFGGGVAGCSTGHIYMYMQHGCAIYDNYDMVYEDSPHYASSSKNDDKEHCERFYGFFDHGHADYFCALESMVSGGMLGGGTANWEGSSDGAHVDYVGRDDIIQANYVMGLDSHASEADKLAAEAEARLYINGNRSFTHGGGILCNGDLSIGAIEPVEIPVAFQPDAIKVLVDSSGNELSMDDYEFHFSITDHLGNELSHGVTDRTGHITFDRLLIMRTAGTFTYYIYEQKQSEYQNVQTDPAVYRLQTTVAKGTANSEGRTNLKVTSFVLEKQNAQGEWELISKESNSNYIGTILLLVYEGTPAFVNMYMENTDIQVQKVWNGSSSQAVTVRLYRDDVLVDTQTLNSQNSWSYTWSDMPVGDGTRKYVYRVQEDSVAGYVTKYYSETKALSYWVPATSLTLGKEYLITNSDGSYAMMLTQGNANATLTTSDRAAVSRKSGRLTIAGKTHTEWFEGDMTKDMVFVMTETTNPSYRTLKNMLRGSWLATTSTGSWSKKYYLQGRTTKSECSAFYLNNSRLQGSNGNDYTDSTRYNVVYSSNKFTSASSSTTSGVVKLYERVRTSDRLVFTIVNTPMESIQYEIRLEKVSERDGSGLVGAKFQLLDSNGAARSFTTAGDGIYTYSTANGATTELITSTGGRMVITGLPAGAYTLRETEAPVGHMPIEDYTLHLGEDSQGTTISLRLVDPVIGYVLPETGGNGTTLYIVVGSVLMLTGGTLLYRKRRREAVENS